MQKKSMISKLLTSTSGSFFSQAYLKKQELTDEVDFVQLGQQALIEFTSTEFGSTEPSAFSIWPTKEDPTVYKYNAFYLELRPELTTIERQTYSLLAWIGDVGGLLDGLWYMFKIIVRPFTAFAVKAEVLSQVFRLSGSMKPELEQDKSAKAKESDISHKKTNYEKAKKLSRLHEKLKKIP